MKYSKELIELRYKQDKLTKLQKYEDAEVVKQKADER